MKPTVTYIHEHLQALYPPEEIRCFVRLILAAVCGLSHQQQILGKDTKIPGNEKKQIYAIVDRLAKMEPLQYILGETEFYSIPLKVNPSVLIPRPETEELADLIIKLFLHESHEFSRTARADLQSVRPSIFNSRDGFHPSLLDIGTGSGCISIALAKHIPNAVVTAIDISEAALQTASENARQNNTTIRFIQADILDTAKTIALFPEKFDLIVSNPPYIMEHEKASINANVLSYEPHSALFVPNDDPLLFYRTIADFALQKLTPQGILFLEINPLCNTSIIDLLQKKGFSQTEVLHDLYGKIRFISAKNS